MLFAGIQKLTLLDYPQHVARTLFTQGCGYPLPVLPQFLSVALGHARAADDGGNRAAFLKKRQGTLDGVCFTGGEPLMQDDLSDFIGQVRKLGFLIKLDTNGSQPEKLHALIDAGLVDMVAMDIKNSPAHYARTVGLPHFDLFPRAGKRRPC